MELILKKAFPNEIILKQDKISGHSVDFCFPLHKLGMEKGHMERPKAKEREKNKKKS